MRGFPWGDDPISLLKQVTSCGIIIITISFYTVYVAKAIPSNVIPQLAECPN